MRMGRRFALPAWAVLACGMLAALPARAGMFGIALTYSGFTTTQEQLFHDAVTYWEGALTGTAASADVSLQIDAVAEAIDGAGMVLGNASASTTLADSGFLYNTGGRINVDTVDLASLSNTQLYWIMLHELAHVIGFGDANIWSFYGVYTQGSYQYTGAHALAAYQAEFDPSATFVPVENNLGSGSADSHWDESWAGGPAELMTPLLDSNPFVSETTLQSFADIGFVVTPVPLPASSLLLLSVCVMAAGLRRRRRGRALHRSSGA